MVGKELMKENNLSEEQIAELFETFTLFDKDYNGALNTKELGIIMQSTGLSVIDSELKEMVDEVNTKKLDEEDNRLIDFPEFVSVCDFHL
jgi:Ca2+-binding EF-hand superfamily protein